MKIVALAVLLAAGVASAQAPAVADAPAVREGPVPGCAPGASCPAQAIPGTVVVGLAFDGLGSRATKPDGMLTSDEIQCAIDCVNGDPAPEHVLPVKRALYDVPPFVSGGTIVFVPENPPGGLKAIVGMPKLRYSIDEPLDLPFSATSLVLRGDGATIRLATPPSAPSRSIFRRLIHSNASPRDVEFLTGWTNGYVFEGFTFEDPHPGTPGAPSTAIELHGAWHLVVERCRFNGFDRGVELHTCLMATIRDCLFTGGRDRDVIIGDGTDCGGVTGPCWTGTEGWQRATGSHHARLEGTHHFTHPSATASIQVRDSIQPVITHPTFEGTRPRHCVLVEWPRMGTDVTLRDVYVEFGEDARGTGLFRFECGGVARIDGLTYVGAYPGEILVDTSGTTELQVTLEHCGWLSPTVQFSNGPGRSRNMYSFRDVVAAGPALDDPARWTGGAIPINLRVDPPPPARPTPAPSPAPAPKPPKRRR